MRNEAAFLPYFLRHYETFAERIFIWEGASNDGTRELLEAHPLVTVFDQESQGLDNHYFTRVFMEYRRLSRGQADWCISVGGDELVYHPHILTKLHYLTCEGVLKVQLRGYTMYHHEFPQTKKQIYDVVKLGYPDIWSTKTILFNPQAEMSWLPGLHIENSGDKPYRRSGIKLLHYRYFGAEYYEQRNRKNYAAFKEAGSKVEFDLNRSHNLPDGTRGNPYKWFAENTDRLIQVVA